MTLLETAMQDAHDIVGDADGFSQTVIITGPGVGQTFTGTGIVNDVAFHVDSDTGQVITTRTITVSVSIKALTDANFPIPKASQGGDTAFTVSAPNRLDPLRVADAKPDRTLGVVVLTLQAV